MIKKIKISLLIAVFALLGLAGNVNAAALTWTADQTVDLSSPDVNLTIVSGSEATSLVVGTESIQVVLGDGDVFTTTVANRGFIVIGDTTSGVANTCDNDGTTGRAVITGGAAGETITLKPTAGLCEAGGGGGGGGGGSSKPKTTTPVVPVVTPPAIGAGQVCSYNLGLGTLKNGSRGEAVMELQRFLNATMNLGLVVDGALGPKTIAVMMQWQNTNGLASDGLIGPMTKAKINGIAAARCGATPATPAVPGVSPAIPATPVAYAFGTSLVKEGTKGEACKAWQMFLNDKANAGLMADGNCGPKTMLAAKAWQASVGLTADGVLGAMSRAKAETQ
ncbi:hypothetical protein A2121_01360 [Candidatus Nomurabacteria bacterium GWB1_40_6]|uniref:Peptidoglycan binding-like domain-containing protein n=1 Tax=Candidatus Nomurabacteria bacterium GWB1_40_6 TaxID=1801727 RepID=A0A1F6TLX4_9BACT|nr:MAG: hypothetical protein A2121_01360 [Candidatus Nomurabacteria bacterium GWB1_40_6]